MWPVILLLILCVGWAIPFAAAQDVCAGQHLIVGGTGDVRFTDGEPLNVRAEPGRAGSVIGRLNEGARFDVVGESTCKDGIVWWQIEAGDLTGWIAQGQGEVFYVRPIPSDVLAAEAEFAALPEMDVPETTPAPSLEIDISAEIDERTFVNARPSPDGSRIAWLYSDCESNFGCAPDTDYVLSVTDANGDDRQTIWQGAPDDFGRFRIVGWRSDGEAVFIGIYDTRPYPEPGSPIESDPGYPPEPDLFEVPLDGSAVDGEYSAYAAISADGAWTVERGRDNFLHIRSAEAEHTVPYPGYWLAVQFSFSPQNDALVWAMLHYSEFNLTSVTLQALDLHDGTVTTLYDFPAGYPFTRRWLDDTQLLVDWADLQWDVSYRLHETVRESLVFDVATGEIYRAS